MKQPIADLHLADLKRLAEGRPDWLKDFVESQSQGFKSFETSIVEAITTGFKAQADHDDAMYEDVEGEESDCGDNPDMSTSQYQAKRHCPDALSDTESAGPMDALLSKGKESDATSDEDLLQQWLRLDSIDESVTEPVVEGLATLLNSILKTSANKEKEKQLTEKFSRPKNCTKLVVPKVNEEIWKILRRFSRQGDFNLQQAQAALLKAGFAMISIIKEHLTPDKQQTAKNIY